MSDAGARAVSRGQAFYSGECGIPAAIALQPSSEASVVSVLTTNPSGMNRACDGREHNSSAAVSNNLEKSI